MNELGEVVYAAFKKEKIRMRIKGKVCVSQNRKTGMAVTQDYG